MPKYKLYKVLPAGFRIIYSSPRAFIDLHQEAASKIPPFFETREAAQIWLNEHHSSNTVQEFAVIEILHACK